MLVISTSDKGGTGRSVTTCNIAYRRSLLGDHVCYLDFDFGSPTSGAVFGLEEATHGVKGGGLHDYLQGHVGDPHRVDIWSAANRRVLGARPNSAGRLVLLPGDLGGGEFNMNEAITDRCVALLRRLQEEFDVVFMDLSAGRSHAAEMVLEATARPAIHEAGVRWLVFHRWTRQHVTAAAGLVYGDRGLLDIGEEFGHDRDDLLERIRFVRTAVVTAWRDQGLRPTQEAWLRRVDEDLGERAISLDLGRSYVLGTVPLDPVLQWREQLLTDRNVHDGVANAETVQRFQDLAEAVTGDWRRL